MTQVVSFERRILMHRFVTHLQLLAGELNELPPAELLDRFDELAANVPDLPSRVEQLAIGTLLYEALQQLARILGLEPCLANSALDRQIFAQVIRRLRELHGSTRVDRRVSEFLRILARRYSEEDLSVAKVADEMRLSRYYLIRILKQSTGHGFRWHLHAHRIDRAKQLLAESMLTVKEIAASVGYTRTSQFDRCFWASVGSTPSKYRSAYTQHSSGNGIVACHPFRVRVL